MSKLSRYRLGTSRTQTHSNHIEQEVERTITSYKPATFQAFSMEEEDRDVSLGQTISASLGYTYAPFNNAESKLSPKYVPPAVTIDVGYFAYMCSNV